MTGEGRLGVGNGNGVGVVLRGSRVGASRARGRDGRREGEEGLDAVGAGQRSALDLSERGRLDSPPVQALLELFQLIGAELGWGGRVKSVRKSDLRLDSGGKAVEVSVNTMPERGSPALTRPCAC